MLMPPKKFWTSRNELLAVNLANAESVRPCNMSTLRFGTRVPDLTWSGGPLVASDKKEGPAVAVASKVDPTVLVPIGTGDPGIGFGHLGTPSNEINYC